MSDCGCPDLFGRHYRVQRAGLPGWWHPFLAKGYPTGVDWQRCRSDEPNA